MQSAVDEPESGQASERGDETAPRHSLLEPIYDGLDPEWKLLEDFAQNMSTVCRRRIEERREDTRWTLVRPRTSWDFIDFGNIEPAIPLFDYHTDKEKQLVEDLLNCFLGFHGRYISAAHLSDPNGTRMFTISDNVTGICRSMAMRLVPLASYYSRVVRFIQSGLDLNSGRVNQALSAFLQEKIIKFSEIVVTLDERHSNNPLDLNQIYVYLQGTMASMKVLNGIVCAVQNLRGGQTLSALHRFINLCIVDSKARQLSVDAIIAASEPYFQSVSMWIYKGILFDPFGEFMISKKGNGKEPSNWDGMFIIKENEVPVFLKQCQTYIHKAGKYLDAVRRCVPESKEIRHCREEQLVYYSNDDTNYINMIRGAYNFANLALRDVVLKKYNLFERIKIVKSFLCLEGGDLFHNIIDNCAEELDRPAHEVCVSYLPLLINSSVETSSLGRVKYADQMALFLEKETLRWQVYNLHPFNNKKEECREEQSGMEALTFKVNASWPITLVIHQMAVKCYQILFRHLFYLKRVHFKLVRARQKNKFSSMRQYYIKHIMTVFLQCCISYMTTGIIEVYWLEFEVAFAEATNLEEIRQAHDNMLYKCLQGCMLASPKLFHKLKKVVGICSQFADDMSLVHENPFIISVSRLINAVNLGGPTSGLDNFTKEITPILEYEPRIAFY